MLSASSDVLQSQVRFSAPLHALLPGIPAGMKLWSGVPCIVWNKWDFTHCLCFLFCSQEGFGPSPCFVATFRKPCMQLQKPFLGALIFSPRRTQIVLRARSRRKYQVSPVLLLLLVPGVSAFPFFMKRGLQHSFCLPENL